MSIALPIDRIVIRPDARPIDEATVSGLVESIAKVGLISPIRVRDVGGRWEVVAGVHRLTAFQRLGLVDIEAIVTEDDDLHAELAMIDENLCRAELSPADRAKQTFRRKEIYEALHPETVHGVNQHTSSRQVGDSSAERFTSDTATVSGKSERAVQRDAERGEKVIDAAIEVIRGTVLDTGTYLDKLKKLSPSEQVFAARRDLAWHRSQERERQRDAKAAKLQADVKARAAREVAELIAEHVPGEWWDGIKSNLYAAGAKNIADALTNITGESVRSAA